MRVVLLSLLCLSVLAGGAFAQQQTWTPQTYTPQTFTPQTHAPQAHAPQGWTAQTGEASNRPRRRRVRCSMGGDDFCVFTTVRDFRPGSPCSCNGYRGVTN